MHDHEFRSHVADIRKAAEGVIQPLGQLMQLAYELREACRFYEPAGEDGSDLAAARGLQDDSGAIASDNSEAGARGGSLEPETPLEQLARDDRGKPDGAPAARQVREALPVHVLSHQPYKFTRIPNADDARAVLDSFDDDVVNMSEYYDAFRKYCIDNHLAMLQRRGVRYLAHYNGWDNGRDKNGYTALRRGK